MIDQKQLNMDIQPWGRAVGLIAGCVVILTGLMRDVGPAEIALRAVISGVLTAAVVRGFIWLMVLCTVDRPERPGI